MTLRKNVAWIVALVALAACEDISTSGSSQAADTTLPAPAVQALFPACPVASPADAAAMAGMLMTTRDSEGKSLVEGNARLDVIAQSHACDMAAQGAPGYAGSNGSSILHRSRAGGYNACSIGQLVGTERGAAQQMARWMAAEPARMTILQQGLRQLGVGNATGRDGRVYWSVVLAGDC